MELTRSAAEQRLAGLKQIGVVKSMTVSVGHGCRLTVRVAALSEESERQVRAAVSDTHWPLNIVEAKVEEADDGLTQSERFIKAAQELGTDDDPERFAERVRKLAKAPSGKSHPAPGAKPQS